MTNKTITRRGGFALTLCAIAIGQAWAQETPTVPPTPSPPAADTAGQTLETVVVTSQKRKEKVQEVPISVTVVDSRQLERQGVSTLTDLSKASASLEFGAPDSSVGGGGYVRGIGTNSFGMTAQASVGVVLDGVVMGNTNISSIFDIDRVEILKGPQGTLFGNSVSAGVISLTTKAPDTERRSGSFSTELSSQAMGSEYERKVLRATFNQPLSETSAVRLAVYNTTNNGVQNNTTQGSESLGTENGLRVRYLNKLRPDLTLNLIADVNQLRKTGGDYLTYRVAPAGSALANALAACGVTASAQNFTSCGTIVNRNNDVDDRGLSAQVDWDVAGHTLTSITSYRTNHTQSRTDVMGIPADVAENAFGGCRFFDCVPIFGIEASGDIRRKQFTQEVRLASAQNRQFEYVVGAFYQHYSHDQYKPGVLIANFGGGTATTNQVVRSQVDTDDVAAFGQATYYLQPDWRLIAGARVTHSKVAEVASDTDQTPQSGSLQTTATKFSYRLGVQHDFAKNTMGYATLATGYKGPQIDDATPGALVAVKPEIPTSLEVGAKTSLFGNRLAFNANFFYTEVKDYQGQSCSPNVANGTVICSPANVPKVITKGIEFDIFGRPLRGLVLNLSAIYNPAKYPGNYYAEDGTNLGGTQLTRASKTKVTLSGEYTYRVNDTYAVLLGADSTYRSKVSLYPSADPVYVVKPGWNTNVRLGLQSASDWTLSLFARNIGRNRFPRDLFPTPFQPGGMWQYYDASAKRVAGVQFETKF